MFKHMFDPASIAAFRLLIVVTQVGTAALVVSVASAIRRWLVIPIMSGRWRHD